MRRRVVHFNGAAEPLAESKCGADNLVDRQGGLDHVIVLNRRHLRHILNGYFSYYYRCRTHLSVRKYAPEPRERQSAEVGEVVAFPEVGGLHHRYGRRAA